MQEKTADQYLHEAWDAVQGRRLEELRTLRSDIIMDINSYWRQLKYYQTNLEYLSEAKELLEEEYDVTVKEVQKYKTLGEELNKVYDIILKWVNRMENKGLPKQGEQFPCLAEITYCN